MSITKNTYTKTVSYWDCGYGHHHRDKQVALKCEKRNSGRDLSKLNRIATDTKHRAMVEHWLQCRNFKETAKYFDLSYGWTIDVIKRSREYYKTIGSEWAHPMFLPSLRALKKVGIEGVEETKNFLNENFGYPEKVVGYREWDEQGFDWFNWRDYIYIVRWLHFHDKD